jgi:Family of unknown function (DUF6411)
VTLAVIIVICVVLFLLAIALPLASRRPQRAVGRSLGAGARTGRKAPGKLGWLFSKPFGASRKATDRSGGAGRRLGQRLRS